MFKLLLFKSAAAVSSFLDNPKLISFTPPNNDWNSGRPIKTVLLAEGKIVDIVNTNLVSTK